VLAASQDVKQPFISVACPESRSEFPEAPHTGPPSMNRIVAGVLSVRTGAGESAGAVIGGIHFASPREIHTVLVGLEERLIGRPVNNDQFQHLFSLAAFPP